jgi:Spy/CpxP family protein refolding chaperone
MRRSTLTCLLLLTVTPPVAAQGQADSHPRSPALRERIERRFAERVKEELGLTEEQAARLKAVATEHGGHRKGLRRRERALRAALDDQIRSGTTADQDSVARLTRELLDLRVEYAESWRKEMGELTFLTPAQRAQLLVMRERLLQRVHELKKDHRGYRGHGDAH